MQEGPKTPQKGLDRTEIFGAREGKEGIIRCDACPVLCRIRPGRTGACDRYANTDGRLIRTDPLVLAQRIRDEGGKVVPFLANEPKWDGNPITGSDVFITAIGSGTTYPDYKPAPFIVSSEYEGVDTVTVVTEGIFSYCGVKVKIDTDRHIGAETAAVRSEGEHIGHVTTAEYGSQMLSLGGVRHLTGGTKKEGNITCKVMMALCNKQPIELAIDDGSSMIVQAGQAPVIDGVEEQRMRVGCGSAAIGIFAQQWHGEAAEVVVVAARNRKESRGGHAREDFSERDDDEWMKHTLAYVDNKGNVTIDYRPVHTYTLTDEVQYIPPKARVY